MQGLTRSWLLAGLCCSLVSAAPSAALAETTTFTSRDGTDPQNWHSAANWDNGVPGEDDDAVIPAGHLASVKTMPAVARSVNVGGVPQGVPGPGQLVVDGMGVSLTVGTGSSAIDGGLRVRNSADIELGGTTTYGSNADITLETGQLTNTGTLEVPAGRSISTFGTSVVHNTGTIRVASGAGSFTISGLDNDGVVEVDTGAFVHNGPGSGTSSGTFVLAADTVLAFNSSFTVGGAGSGIEGGEGTVTTTNSDANVQIAADAVFDPAAVLLASGRLRLAVDAEIDDLTLSSISTLEGAGALTVTDSLTSGGIFEASGSTTVLGSVDFDGGSIRNGHTLTLPTASTTTVDDTFTVGDRGTLVNPGRLELPGTAVIGNGGGSVVNSGTVARTAGSATAEIQPPLRNTGTVRVETGTLGLGGGLTQAAGRTAVLGGAVLDGSVALEGGALDGSGTIEGSVTNTGGQVQPGASPGILTVTGSYTQGPDGALEAEIEGTIAGSGYDQLQVGGTATLDGTLAIVNAAGFTPDEADRFDVVASTGSLSGEFATLTGAQIAAGTYQDSYTAGPPGKATLGLTLAPANTTAPSIPADGQTGDTITCNPGTWTGNPTFTFQWLRDGAVIGGATGSTYVLTTADEGRTIVCRVTATNAGGVAVADSNGLSASAPPLPASAPGPAPSPAPQPAPTTPAEPSPPPPPASVALADLGDECLPVGNFRYRFTVPLKKLFRGVRVNRRSRVREVRFVLDGRAIGRDRRRPYIAAIDGNALTPGRHRLDAIVVLQVRTRSRTRTIGRRQTFRFDACTDTPGAPGLRASDLLSLPSQDRCVRDGRLRLLARSAGGAEVRRISIAASGGARDRIVITQANRRWRLRHGRRTIARARGGQIRETVALARRPPRAFTLLAVIETAEGARLTLTRRYEPCPRRR